MKQRTTVLRGCLATCALLSVLGSGAAAQDNKAYAALTKEKCEASAPKDPALWDKTLLFGLNITGGNSNTSLVNGKVAVARDYESNIWNFSLGGAYSQQESKTSGEDETTQNNVNAEGSYKRLFDEVYYGGFTTKFLYDEIADVDYRVTLKPGLGMFLVREDDVKLSVEGGPGYLFERVGEEDDNYFAPFVGNRLDWVITATSKLYETTEVIFDAEDSENYLVTAELGLEAAINGSLSLVFSVTDNYDGVPAPDKESNDVVVGSALKVLL